MKQINGTFFPVTRLGCENTELGAYHTNMCMISGNLCRIHT